jgi:hypothetical protein
MEQGLRMNMVAALEELEASVEAARRGLLKSTDPAVLVMRPEAQRAEAVAVLSALYYRDEQAPEKTLLDPGVMSSADPDLTAWVERVNRAKAAFRAARLAYVEMHGRRHQKGRGEALKRVLRALRHGRLNLLQCDRRWNLLPPETTKVGFSWCDGGRNIQRTCVREVRDRLAQQEQAGTVIPGAWQALAGLPEQEPLAIARSRSFHVRANAVLQDGARRSWMASAPLLFPGDRLPEHNLLPSTPPQRSRLRRSDQTVSDAPLIPALQVYPYLGSLADPTRRLNAQDQDARRTRRQPHAPAPPQRGVRH